MSDTVFDRRMVPRAAEMLSSAFHDDMFLANYFPDSTRRLAVGRLFFQFPLCAGLSVGEVFATSPRIEGVAVWFPPATYPLSMRSMLHAVPFLTALRFGIAGGARMKALGDFFDTLHSRLAPPNHWFLELLGVDPDAQGRGHASALLRPMLARIDGEGCPCYLETTNPDNVSMYEHFGFEVRTSGTVPDTRIDYWCMLRP
ncbi:MAG: GNAT family N-acetyltransferase [Spirochaetaceae bacterium]|nr:GNAT family N-acetyltransferase [Spirochaetaceae bacterium]